jgi:hypothetical protein
VVIAYGLLYGGLLWLADGLPYVIDNNETFSSLWHAHNLSRFDLAASAGLADEAFAFHAQAHPFVHTHQGNVPRLFAYVIYQLGARSGESQILVTTFTVGLASVIMAFAFLRRLAGPLFATLFCLLLMSDYVLVAQWQVVTYRVWHMFFVFSSLHCVFLLERRRLPGLLATVANFAALFYYELVFVAFVAISTGLFAAMHFRARWRLTALFAAAQAAGAALAIAVLLAQLTAYMGWDGVLHDFGYTFVGRNYDIGGASFLAEVRAFYDSHNIAFWYNLMDGAVYRTFRYFVGSLTHFELFVHTPFFTAICAIVIAGFLVGAVTRAKGERPELFLSRLRGSGVEIAMSTPVVVATALGLAHLQLRHRHGDFGMLEWLAVAGLIASFVAMPLLQRGGRPGRSPGPAAMSADRYWSAALAILASAAPSAVANASAGFTYEGLYSLLDFIDPLVLAAALIWLLLGLDRASAGRWLGALGEVLRAVFSSFGLVFAFSLLGILVAEQETLFGVAGPADLSHFTDSGVLACAALLATAAMATVAWAAHPGPGWIRAIVLPSAEAARVYGRLSVYLLAVVLASALATRGYRQGYAPLWLDIAGGSTARIIWIGTFVAGVAVSSLFALRLWPLAGAASAFRRLRALLPFLLAGLAAYVVVFLLSPAYIFTGYRFRTTPFTVFHTTTLAAVAMYPMLCAVGDRFDVSSRGNAASGADGSRAGPGVRRVQSALAFLLAMALFVGMAGYWVQLQAAYVRLLPPTHYSFLKRLAEPPFRGATFVVGGYGAPIAAATRNWAYLEEKLASGKVSRDAADGQLMLDDKYRWFADKDTNGAYERPDYFLCVAQQTVNSVAMEANQRAGIGPGYGGCELNPLVRIARGLQTNPLSMKVDLAAGDAEGPALVGYERWAIVRLHWDGSASR